VTVPSYEDFFGAYERAVTLYQGKVTIDAVRAVGSNANLIGVGGATMAQELALWAQGEFAGMFLSTAIKRGGEVLERWVFDRYGLRRRKASAAVVPLSFARQGSAGFTIPAGFLVSTPGGVVFETLNDLPVPPNVLGPFGVNAVAQVVGTAGNVSVNTITQIVAPISDDTTLAVRNIENAAGGTEDQTDTEFVALAQEFYVAEQRGTETAVKAAALNVPGVASAETSEPVDGAGDPAGYGLITIADGNGGGNSVLAANVQFALRGYRGLGVPIFVVAGTPIYVDVEINGLAFQAGFDSTTILAAARVRIVAVINALAPGQRLEVAALYAALKATPGLIVPLGSIVEPAGDIVPNTGFVLRTTADRAVLNGVAGVA
jgi:uncharacterized phage protein gp47/JayE